MKRAQRKIVIFSDMDGTLLDHQTYSTNAVSRALSHIKKLGFPLILVSSKTAEEMAYWCNELNIADPFIVENGSAVFFESGFFGKDGNYFDHPELNLQYLMLGEKVDGLKPAFVQLSTRFPVKGFFQMSEEEIMEKTGLTQEQAGMASHREFSIPFIISDTEKENIIDLMRTKIASKNLEITQGGRFYHLLGKTDKGKAIKQLLKLFKKKFPATEFYSYAFGDAPNDLPMLQAVDQPILVEKPNGGYREMETPVNLIKAEGIGPSGWQWAFDQIIIKNRETYYG